MRSTSHRNLLRAGLLLAAVLLGGFKHGTSAVAPPIAPVLSAQSAFADGTDWFLGNVTTDTGSGSLYAIATTNCGSAPSVGQIQTGKDSTGASAPAFVNAQSVSGAGIQNVNTSGLTAATTYCVYFQQHASSGDSTVVKATAFDGTTAFKTGGTITFNPTYQTGTEVWPGGAYTTSANSTFSILQNCFTAGTNVTLSLTVEINTGCGGAGCSFPNIFTPDSYAAVISGFATIPNQNSQQRTAYANLPGSDPLGVGSNYTFYFASQASTGVSASVSIGSLRFGQTASNLDPSANCTGGQFCMVWIQLHEVSELLGRFSQYQNGSPSTTDLFRYTAAGVRSGASNVGYISHDGGTTNVIAGNVLASSGDWGDTNGGAYCSSLVTSYCVQSPPVLLAQDIKYISLVTGFGLTHSCRITAGLSFLIPANDNTPMFLNKVA